MVRITFSPRDERISERTREAIVQEVIRIWIEEEEMSDEPNQKSIDNDHEKK